MRKHRLPRIQLTRETLRNLEGASLGQVAGGATNTCTCFHTTCLSDCIQCTYTCAPC